jgi:hypothetical protein
LRAVRQGCHSRVTARAAPSQLSAAQGACPRLEYGKRYGRSGDIPNLARIMFGVFVQALRDELTKQLQRSESILSNAETEGR